MICVLIFFSSKTFKKILITASFLFFFNRRTGISFSIRLLPLWLTLRRQKRNQTKNRPEHETISLHILLHRNAKHNIRNALSQSHSRRRQTRQLPRLSRCRRDRKTPTHRLWLRHRHVSVSAGHDIHESRYDGEFRVLRDARRPAVELPHGFVLRGGNGTRFAISQVHRGAEEGKYVVDNAKIAEVFASRSLE